MQLENERIQNTQNVISKLQQELSSYRISTANFFPEAKVLFPELTSISLAKMQVFDSTDTTGFISVIAYTSDKPVANEQEIKLKNWLRTKLKIDSLEVYRRITDKID